MFSGKWEKNYYKKKKKKKVQRERKSTVANHICEHYCISKEIFNTLAKVIVVNFLLLAIHSIKLLNFYRDECIKHEIVQQFKAASDTVTSVGHFLSSQASWKKKNMRWGGPVLTT